MFFGRSTLLTLGLAGAVTVPFLLDSGGELLDSVTKSFTGSPSGAASDPDGILGSGGGTYDPSAGLGAAPRTPRSVAGGPPGSPAAAALPPIPRIDGQPAAHLGEVLRFDVTPAWVLQRWSRVTTIPTISGLQGYRVALVTGTEPHDLAGSLTYYFDPLTQVRRIKFRGSTGDPAMLVALVSSRFGFVAVRGEPGIHVYQILWNGHPTSELRLRMADVVRSDRPHLRFEVDLEINHPDGRLSREEVELAQRPPRPVPPPAAEANPGR